MRDTVYIWGFSSSSAFSNVRFAHCVGGGKGFMASVEANVAGVGHGQQRPALIEIAYKNKNFYTMKYKRKTFA